jgi:transcriptional regulator with XRE-family HTH domain
MAASFEQTRALLRECLEYPGQSFTTLAKVARCKHRSMVQSWIDGETVPKSRQDWPRIGQRVRRHLESLRSAGADPEHCDAGWRERLQAYLREHGLTPDAFATSVGTSPWHGRRWAKFGEVPHDAAMPKISRLINYDFDASAFCRAYAVATQRLGQSMPAPLAGADSAQALRDAIVEIRTRSGLTIPALAKRARLRASQLEGLGSRHGGAQRQKLYGVRTIAEVIVQLARYVLAHPEHFAASSGGAPAAIEQALAVLAHRPTRPKGPVKGRTTVRWDRMERSLRTGSHRFFGYRCPNGTFAAVVFVRFCIAYEQSGCTTRDAAQRTGISTGRLGDWLNGRVLPDFPMLGELQRAVERLEGRVGAPAAMMATGAVPAGAAPPAEAAAAPAAVPAAPVPPAAEPTAVPLTDGASDILVGMASTARGLRAMHRAGWRPDAAGREHLTTIVRTAMEVGGLTAEDLKPKATIPVADASAPAVRAAFDAFPHLRGRSHRGGRKE